MTVTAPFYSTLLRGRAPLTLRLEDAASETRAGGKAHNLFRAIGVGVRVPTGVVLTTQALDDHLIEHGLRAEIDGAVARVMSAAVDRRADAACVSAVEIRALIVGSPMSLPTREALHAATRELLAAGAVVVRSSAIGEDSVRESFAGQLDSFLHVHTPEELERDVLQCWASCWSERALAYRAARAVQERGMGVIVQRQIDARAAGVLFTRGYDDTLLVEYVPGLADDLVAGAADPGRLTIRRDGTSAERLQSPESPDPRVEELMLSPGIIAQFAEAARTLERGLGGPQDVEWAIDSSDTLFIVQSRPVTAALSKSPRRASGGGASVRWTNANVNENFPAPISPLLYSIASAGYANYFRNLARAFGLSGRRIAAMDDALRHIIGVHGARMYYNLTSIHTVLRSAPMGDELVAAFNGFVGASGSEGAPVRMPGSRLRDRAELLAIAAKTMWTYRTLRARVEAFERCIDDFSARAAPATLARSSLRELRLLMSELMDIRCNRWTNAGLADAAAMFSYAALQRLIEGARDDVAGRSLHNTLLKAIPHLVSAEPVRRLWDLSRLVREDPALAALFDGDSRNALEAIRADIRFAAFRAMFDAYLEHCGFRCSAELMLTVPSFDEDPLPVIETIRAYAQLDGESPSEALARQVVERENETIRVLRAVRGRRLSTWLPFVGYGLAIRVALRWTHLSIGFRERARLKQALLYSRCRRIALALGDRFVETGHFGARDDVFWLTVAELDELAAGAAMFPQHVRELVAVRKRAHAQLAATAPPDHFTIAEGEYLALDGAGSAEPSPVEAEVDDRLSGTVACGGRATGRAIVLRDVREAGRICAGDILVTRQTDPGWAPVFFLIKGLVIERGGMLSHGAIVAREFGIPCLVGVRRATERIPEGQTIAVDGERGVVDVLD